MTKRTGPPRDPDPPDPPDPPEPPDPLDPLAAPDPSKRALRSRLRAARRERDLTVDPPTRQRAAADLSRHITTELLRRRPRPRRVAVFLSLPTEVPTDALLADLLAAGIEPLVPVLLDDKDLDWRVWTAPGDLDDPGDPGDLGERLGLHAIASCDVVFVPAMAIDAQGRRLGQGGGSYDRALPRRRPGAPLVAVVADEEFGLQPLPSEPHDEPVDAVVTPGGGWVALPLR